ncbi:Cyclic AMP-responsive element-binding 3 [Rhynchospora pubera]|uniref:Cyclic AMP-responsive element-binding 3 n=1 Tax=Rhynchospora pubera TaxID=906938 RepID=A0AAV8EU23_9POAL|nr:Cyclic AMP-responsive element-binding 3 [Rhynchospora pubera]
MELFGKPVIVSEHNHAIFLSSILCPDGPAPTHKCDYRCQNEHIFGNMYRCRLTGLTHICDKNCDQRILYDNHSSLCRVSGQVFRLSPLEVQAVRGVRRKLENERGEASEGGSCGFKKRRRESPFERSYGVVAPIPTQAGDGMDMS